MDTDRPYREGAAAVLLQLDDVVAARDFEGTSQTEGAHDVEVALAGGTSVAVEVTRLVDGLALGTFNELQKRSQRFPISASGTWEVLLGDGPVNVKQLARQLGAVAARLELLGVRRADPLTWTLDPPEVGRDWQTVRTIFEELERFAVLDFVLIHVGGQTLRVLGPVYGGISSPAQLCAGIEARVAAKASEVRGRSEEAWVFVWVDWTNVLAGRVLRPDALAPLPAIEKPSGIHRVVASVIAFDASEQRLPVAQWASSTTPSREWVDRNAIDACFR